MWQPEAKPDEKPEELVEHTLKPIRPVKGLHLAIHVLLPRSAQRTARKLRRAGEKFIPQSTRASSFKRLLGGAPLALECRRRSRAVGCCSDRSGGYSRWHS